MNRVQRGEQFDKIILKEDHPLTQEEHEKCPACRKGFSGGQAITLVTIGPGDDSEGMKACREGRAYNAVAIPAHWWCVTGEEA